MRLTARSMSFISMGEWARLRSRSRNRAASSGEPTPREASTAESRAGYPAARRQSAAGPPQAPPVHRAYFMGYPSFCQAPLLPEGYAAPK